MILFISMGCERRNVENSQHSSDTAQHSQPIEAPLQNQQNNDLSGSKKTSSPIIKTREHSYNISWTLFEKIRNQPELLQNKSKFGSIPIAQPTYRGDILTSIRLIYIDSRSIYAKLGLRSSDVITGIDGKTLADIPNMMQPIEEMMPEQDIQVNIIRNQRHITLSYHLTHQMDWTENAQ